LPEPHPNITITAPSPISDFVSICPTEALTFSLRKLAETKPRTSKQGSTRPAGQSHAVASMPRHAAAAFVLKLLFLTEDTLSQRPLSGELSLKICRAASANYLLSTSLGQPTFIGSTSSLACFHLLSETYLYAATACVPYACHRTNHKGRGPKMPTLAVALGVGLA
jgi:hypothetical protein